MSHSRGDSPAVTAELKDKQGQVKVYYSPVSQSMTRGVQNGTKSNLSKTRINNRIFYTYRMYNKAVSSFSKIYKKSTEVRKHTYRKSPAE